MKIELGDIRIITYNSKQKLRPDYYYDYVSKESQKLTDAQFDKEIVLPPNKEYSLVIDYPLTIPFVKKIKTGKTGITRRKFVNMVCKYYHEIYEQEDKDVGVKTKNIPEMFNRDSSNGRYGIWGHHICDLILVKLEITGQKIRISVDS